MAWKHRIRGNAGNELPRNFIYVYALSEIQDAKNKRRYVDKAHTFKIGHARYCRFENGKWSAQQEITFSKQIEFWLWARDRSQPKNPTWLFSHNWHFQSQLLDFWGELDAGRFNLTLPKRT